MHKNAGDLLSRLANAGKALARQHRPRVVVIAGPTGVGKSELAIHLAHCLNGEVISADALQVYRELSVGANKLAPAHYENVPHHNLSVLSVSQQYSAGEFVSAASQLIPEILSRGRVPIVCGGTYMYLRWLLYGRPQTSVVPTEIVQRVEDLVQADDNWEKSLARLAAVDPVYAQTLAVNDKYRLVRALSHTTYTGSPLPQFSASYRASLQPDPTYDFRCFFCTLPHEQLVRLLDRRCELMISRGFLQEVANLITSCVNLSNSVSKAIGYAQALEFFSNPSTPPLPLHAWRRFHQDFLGASRSFARTQQHNFSQDKNFRACLLTESTKIEVRSKLAALCAASEEDYAASFDLQQDDHVRSLGCAALDRTYRPVDIDYDCTTIEGKRKILNLLQTLRFKWSSPLILKYPNRPRSKHSRSHQVPNPPVNVVPNPPVDVVPNPQVNVAPNPPFNAELVGATARAHERRRTPL